MSFVRKTILRQKQIVMDFRNEEETTLTSDFFLGVQFVPLKDFQL